MIDKLIDISIQFVNEIVPCTIIPHYNRGVRLRNGHFKGVLGPGFHWKIPFFDDIPTCMVKTKTINLPEQTITTADDKSIVCKAVIKYEVEDVQQYLLEVNDAVDACGDMVQGIIRNHLVKLDWKDCNDIEVSSKITGKAQTESKQWGLKIQKVTITDLGQMRSFRLMFTNNNTNAKDIQI